MQYIHPRVDSYPKKYNIPYSKGKTEINLAVIENHIDPSPLVKRALETEHEHATLSVYPGNIDGPARTNLIAAIREINKIPSSLAISLTHGSDSAIRAILSSFSPAGSKVTYPSPTYPHFQNFLDQMHGSLTCDPRVIGRDEDPLEQLTGCADDHGIVYLVSPSIPYGTVINLDRLKQVAMAHPHTLYVIDEAYVEYQSVPQTAIGLTSNVVVTRTFSKAYALASVRIGWVVGEPNVIEVIDAYINQKDVTDYACRLATAALQDNDYYTSAARTVMQRSKGLLAEHPRVTFGPGGNFGLIELKPGDPPAPEVVDLLRDEGFLTRDKSTSTIYPTIRFTIPPPDIAVRFAQALQRVLPCTPKSESSQF